MLDAAIAAEQPEDSHVLMRVAAGSCEEHLLWFLDGHTRIPGDIEVDDFVAALNASRQTGFEVAAVLAALRNIAQQLNTGGVHPEVARIYLMKAGGLQQLIDGGVIKIAPEAPAADSANTSRLLVLPNPAHSPIEQSLGILYRSDQTI